ncbi:MAG: prenyltransferase/squalene oxidase repeat-containing protein [Promethearchaeota archaeon]
MKNKLRIFTIFTLMLIIILTIFTPIALAKSRKTYLTDFLLENKIDDEGFANSFEATSYSLEILNYYNIITVEGWFGSETNVNASILQKNLENDIKAKLNNNSIDVYDLYHFIKSADILKSSIDPNLKDKIIDYVKACRIGGGGFSPTNESTSVSVSSTYHAIKIFSLINETITNENSHKNFVLSCRNNDGGYGGDRSSSSTIVNTYYAVSIINELGNMTDLIKPDLTIDYLNSSYCASESDINNYGGYFPDEQAEHALLSSTYYCVKTISLLNSTKLSFIKEHTIKWVLNRQNFQDGGFVDIGDEYEQKYSSIISSYFAFNTLKILDEDLLLLNEEVFMTEFNYWILITIFSAIGIICMIYIFIWRSKKI